MAEETPNIPITTSDYAALIKLPPPTWLIDVGWALAISALAISVAWCLHWLIFRILTRITTLHENAEETTDKRIIDRVRGPVLWIFITIAISLVSEANASVERIWLQLSRFIVPALLGWTALSILRAVSGALENRADNAEDELAARSRKTRIAIFSRTANFIIIFITVGLILLGIPGVRNIGVTLMASAGLAGLAVGAAAQPALKSLIAGIQMALTEPIRLEDLVVINGETGRVEEIRMSYVVVRTADERRLIVPTAKFFDTIFENWTRVLGGITGSILIPIKPGFPIDPIRAAYLELLAKHPSWDKRSGRLQISNVKPGSVEVTLIMSAADPAQLAALRLAMREEMLEWLREAMPDALCTDS